MLLPALLAIMTTRQEPTKTVRDELEAIRVKYKLPSLCAGAIIDGKVVSVEAVGVRREGSTEAVTNQDVYHWGSITKSFTAALTGVLVQQGKIRWDETLPELFPELADEMDPGYRKATVLQLLSHHSGLTGETYTKGMPDFYVSKKSLPDQRYQYAKVALKEPPIAPPGTKFEYANRGYMVLGCALERITKTPWEKLLREELLDPLEMKSAGFGGAGFDDHTSQPWGHELKDGKLVGMVPSKFADNAQVLGPAGTLHMSVPDMLKWVWFQAQEGRDGGILGPDTFKVLHTPPFDGDYACGILSFNRDWAGGKALWHNGSNTMNYGLFWIAPSKHFGVAVVTNCATEEAKKATDEAAGIFIRRFCK